MTADTGAADTLRKNALGAPHIVFFVIAAAAPLTAVVGVTPAAFVQIASAMGIVLAFAIAGSDPYAVVFDWMSTFGSLGILLLQVMVSLAVVAFFWRDDRGLTVWRRMIAPGLSAAGLTVCIVLMAANLDLVSGSKSLVVQSFPAVLLLIGLAGAGLAAWIKWRRPEANFRIGSQ